MSSKSIRDIEKLQQQFNKLSIVVNGLISVMDNQEKQIAQILQGLKILYEESPEELQKNVKLPKDL